MKIPAAEMELFNEGYELVKDWRPDSMIPSHIHNIRLMAKFAALGARLCVAKGDSPEDIEAFLGGVLLSAFGMGMAAAE